MPKKTSILILILSIITGILIFIAYKNEKEQKAFNIPVKPTIIPTNIPLPVLSFSTNTLDLTDQDPAKNNVDVLIDTKGRAVNGVQIELIYEPKVIFDVKITKPLDSFFGANSVVLINSIDKTQGRISYAVSIPANTSEISGNGKIINLKFFVNRKPGIRNTTITFSPKSTITTLTTPSLVLEELIPLNLIISSSSSAKKIGF